MEAINHPEEVLYLTDVYRQRSEYAISKLSDIDGINIPQAKAAITQGNYYFPGYESPPAGSQIGGTNETICKDSISWSYSPFSIKR